MPFDDPEADPSKAVCLDPHDLVVSKLVAGREKDFEFAEALLAAHLIDADVLSERAELLTVVPDYEAACAPMDRGDHPTVTERWLNWESS